MAYCAYSLGATHTYPTSFFLLIAAWDKGSDADVAGHDAYQVEKYDNSGTSTCPATDPSFIGDHSGTFGGGLGGDGGSGFLGGGAGYELSPSETDLYGLEC